MANVSQMSAVQIMNEHKSKSIHAGPSLSYDLIKRGYMCEKCGKLLAAGAHCPKVHAPREA